MSEQRPTLTEIGMFLKRCDPRLVVEYLEDDINLALAVWSWAEKQTSKAEDESKTFEQAVREIAITVYGYGENDALLKNIFEKRSGGKYSVDWVEGMRLAWAYKETDLQPQRLKLLLDVTEKDLSKVKAENAALHEKLDKLLAHCPDGECAECSKIICPHECELHFHHDGCPACAEHEAEQEGGDK